MKLTDKHIPLTLQLFRGHFSSELSSYKEFINQSSQNIISIQNKFEELYNSEIESTDESDDEPKDDYWNYEHYKVHEIFPSFYRQSTFIGLYSLFETRLCALCENIQRVKEYEKALSAINGYTDIEKCKKYLNLVVGINTDNLNSPWSKIADYQKIRKCIVHHNGCTNQQRYWEGIIQRITHLELISNRIIIVDDRFLLNFIEIISEYMKGILDKIKNEIDFE